MFCTGCGKELPDNARFCPYCRKEVRQAKKQNEASGKSSKQWQILAAAVFLGIIVAFAFWMHDKYSLVGRWEGYDKIIEFGSGGEYYEMDTDFELRGTGTWERSGDKLTISYGDDERMEFDITIEDGSLVIGGWDPEMDEYEELYFEKQEE